MQFLSGRRRSEKHHWKVPGFGPHALRSANVTWRQDVGSSIEVSKIAGHSKVETTLDYAIVGLKRQNELTRRIQDKRAKARRTTKTDAEPVTTLLAPQRLRARNARAARKVKVVEITKESVASDNLDAAPRGIAGAAETYPQT